jgi:uncharacterized membrane protein
LQEHIIAEKQTNKQINKQKKGKERKDNYERKHLTVKQDIIIIVIIIIIIIIGIMVIKSRCIIEVTIFIIIIYKN